MIRQMIAAGLVGFLTAVFMGSCQSKAEAAPTDDKPLPAVPLGHVGSTDERSARALEKISEELEHLRQCQCK